MSDVNLSFFKDYLFEFRLILLDRITYCKPNFSNTSITFSQQVFSDS